MKNIMYESFINKIVVFFTLILSIVFCQSAQDLIKLRSEYENFKKNQTNQNLNISNDPNNQDINSNSAQEILVPLSPIFQFADTANSRLDKFFGYNFFTAQDTLRFWENLPPPASYVLGPGDELIVSLWGETELRKRYNISRDGNFYDEKVGLVNISGKTIELAGEALKKEFSKIYSTLSGSNPSTYIDVTLGKLKLINVNFVGQVNKPGLYPIHPFSNLITALVQIGGVDTTGSLRKITIRRAQKEISVDLYEYFLMGKIPDKIQLRDQDIVYVPIRQSKVELIDAIKKPGIYESLESETVEDLIRYGGGLLPNASKILSVEKIIPIEKRKNDSIVSKNIYLDYKNLNKYYLNDGDKIKAFVVPESEEYVEIFGQIKRPGKYPFSKNMKVKDLINLSGGLSDSTFKKSVYLKNSELVRMSEKNRYGNVIKIDLNNLNDIRNNIVLNNLDKLMIYQNVNFQRKKNVLISGEVNIPGEYPLISDSETLKSVLKRSGGLTNKALKKGISIYRESKYSNYEKLNKDLQEVKTNKRIQVAWSNESIILAPGDSIVVKESSFTVEVLGEVYNPGLIEFKTGKNLSFYINQAGGLTSKANTKGIVIIYPNGIVYPKKWYTNKKIVDGSTIFIDTKEDEIQFNATEFASNWTSILSSIITAYVLATQINSN
jgi:protein involved in polysaccharide export with SLBB domain